MDSQSLLPFKIIFQDDYLLVIDKASGHSVDEVAENLLEKCSVSVDRGGLVHRLDKDTSGVMLVAKAQEILNKLQEQFKERTVKKEYIALVHGSITEPGRVEGAIGRVPRTYAKFTVFSESEDARESVTEYNPVRGIDMPDRAMNLIFGRLPRHQFRKLLMMKYGRFTLLRCFPLTGRTHQIRVHLKYINHPIVGDEKYGGRKMSKLDRFWCPRQFLHAAKITFIHPETQKWVSFESPMPEDLQGALSELKS